MIAVMLRRGFPRELIDYLGNEATGQTFAPEKISMRVHPGARLAVGLGDVAAGEQQPDIGAKRQQFAMGEIGDALDTNTSVAPTPVRARTVPVIRPFSSSWRNCWVNYGVNLMVFTIFELPSGMCCQMSYAAALMRPFSPKLIGPVAPLKCIFWPSRIALIA